MDTENQVWDRRQDESPPAYLAFCCYRDMGPQRSKDKAYRESHPSAKRASGRWDRWQIDYAWYARAQAYDAYLELLARKSREEDHTRELEEFRDRQRRLAKANIEASIRILSKASKRLESLEPEHIPIKSLPQFFRAAAAVADAATNSEAQAIAVNDLLSLLDESNG